MTPVAVLTDLDVERVARRVVELLHDEPPAGRLVDADTLARLLGISRGTVYARAAELGARRLGTGKRARLRFDVEQARAALAERTAPDHDPTPARPPRRRVQRGTAGRVLTPKEPQR